MKATGGSAPTGPEPPQLPDPLPDLLDLASREGALQGEGLVSFLEALRERARLVVAERIERLEERLEGLSEELRKSSEAHGALLAHHRELADELSRASGAHEALIGHHRELVDRVATELVSIASLSPLRARQARRRLLALAELLRADSR